MTLCKHSAQAAQKLCMPLCMEVMHPKPDGGNSGAQNSWNLSQELAQPTACYLLMRVVM